MNKATLLLVTIAALGLGWLIGTGLVNNESVEPAAATPIASAEVPAPSARSTGGAPVLRYIGPVDVSAKFDEFGTALPSTLGENFIGRQGAFKSETVTINLPGDAGVEYKALMKQGDTIVYSWSTDGGQVYYDFHAHDVAFGDEFFTRYAEGEGIADSGAIVAPYPGEHGWYFLSLEENPMIITLSVAGFYSEIIEIDLESAQ